MVAQVRRGKRNWIPALLATFWILLALASSAYLFRLINDPSARRVDTAMASQQSAPTSSTPASLPPAEPPPLSADRPKALFQADKAKDQEIADLKSQLRGLNTQVAELGRRLRPLEKVLGPVAAIPNSASVTTSEPLAENEPAAVDMPPPPPARPSDEKPLPPGASVPQTKPTDLSGLTEKPVEAAKPQAKPAEPLKPPAKPAVEAKAPAKPADASKPLVKPVDDGSTTSRASPATSEPPVPLKPAEAAKQQTASADQASAPVKPAAKPVEKPAETAKASDGAKPLAGATAQPSAKPATPEAKPSVVGPGPVQLSSNEPANSTPSTNTNEAALSPPPPAIPPGTTRFGIELGSVDKQDGVRPMWRDLLTNHAALVAGLQARRIIAPDKKWRLIAGPFSSAAEALQACTLFKKADMPCEATVFAGDSL